MTILNMAISKSSQMCLIVGGVVLIAIFVYFCMSKKSGYNKGTQKNMEVEKFTALAAGANDNTGHLLDDSYDLIKGSDYEVPSEHFADMVNQGDHLREYVDQPKLIGENLRPMERLHRVQGKALMPRVSTHVTPFNVDVANPTSQKYMVNTPRVTLKDPNAEYSLSNFIRGDVLITYNPNVPLIAKSRYGRASLRLDGLFTPYFSALYNKYTGKAYKNLIQNVAGAGQAGGYGGASGGVIMDNY